jgi:hypothetical protein
MGHFNLPEFALQEGQSFLLGVPAQRRLGNASAQILKREERLLGLKYGMPFQGKCNDTNQTGSIVRVIVWDAS